MSLVVSVLNEGSLLVETIESVLDASSRPREVVIVDDGSIDGCVDALDTREWTRRGVVVHHRGHEGIAPARNHGASVATQPVLVFLDGHCAVEPNWLPPLLDALDDHERALAVPVIGDTRAPDERGCGARIVNDLLSYQWLGVPAARTEVGIAPGGCFAARTDVFRRLGGLAPMRDFGLEDVELSLRAWRLDVPIIAVPDSVVIHHFRTCAPYVMNMQSWLENLVRTCLLHLDGDDLTRSLRAAAAFAGFSRAITDVLASPWLAGRVRLDGLAVREMTDYWSRFRAGTAGSA